MTNVPKATKAMQIARAKTVCRKVTGTCANNLVCVRRVGPLPLSPVHAPCVGQPEVALPFPTVR